jgi:hypothetical protein
MYKRDYHPDENIVFKTKNYGFDAPKSTPLEPLSNALVQIDEALKKEETDRIVEDIRINARIDKEIADRENGDTDIRAMLKYHFIHNATPYAGNYGGYENYTFQFLQVGSSVNFTLTINCHGVFDMTLADLFISGNIDSRFPNNTKVAHDYVDEQNNASINIYPNSYAIQVNTSATTNVTFCLNGSFTINVIN